MPFWRGDGPGRPLPLGRAVGQLVRELGELPPERAAERLTADCRFDRAAADNLLAYLAEPHSLGEIAAHRFVYRPEDPIPFAEPVERRSMAQHLTRLLRQGRVREVEPGRFCAA